MKAHIIIKQAPIEEVVKIHAKIPEFDLPYQKATYEARYKEKNPLIVVAYFEGNPAGFIVGYDRYEDQSFYCWMAGVDPAYRRLGIMEELMNYLEAWAKTKGYNKIKIRTRNTRRKMLIFLVKENFNFTNVDSREQIMENRLDLEKNV